MGDIPVLVVDDQSDIRLLVRALITAENAGLRVGGEAATGEEALAFFAHNHAAVVVLDQMMPGMTGIDTARALLEEYPELPIVLFSAYLDDRLRAEASEVGIVRCVDKADFSALAPTVRSVAA